MHHTRLFYLKLVCLFLTFSLVSCSKPKYKPDPFFEKWKILAEQSLGHSPSPSIEPTDIDDVLIPEKEGPPPQPERPLPTNPVSLKMNSMDIKVILQALARAARQNILINSNIYGKLNVNLNKVPWDQAFKGVLRSQGLTYTWEGDIIRVVSKEDLQNDLAIDEIKRKRELNKLEKKQVEPLLTKVIKVNFAEAESLQKLLSELITKDKEGKSRGNILVDKHTNSLVVQAVKDDLHKIINLVKTLDKPTDQIHLKAYIVEATKDVARDLGIQWGGRWTKLLWGRSDKEIEVSGAIGSGGSDAFGTGRKNTGFGINFPASPVTGSDIGTLGAGLNILISNPSGSILEMQLSALQTEGKINILSSPSLTTMDNKMAFTENGQKVPYVTYEDGNKQVKFEDAVLRLEMTPHVINDRYLKMEISVKKDEVDFSVEKKVDGNPTIYKKETQTSLIVENGETIVISGLTKQTIQDAAAGIPGLKDIPGLGYLFKNDSTANRMEEILIFITPTILKKRKDLEVAMKKHPTAEDLAQKLRPTHDPRARTWIEKSRKFLLEKNWDEAIRTASIAIAIDPGNVEPYIYRSAAMWEKGEYEKCLEECNLVLFLDPTNERALNTKGLALEKLGYKQEALNCFEKSCGLGSKYGCENHKRLFYQMQ
ncbi:type IV pilus secretin PilQ [Desulfovulcanus sp.]